MRGRLSILHFLHKTQDQRHCTKQKSHAPLVISQKRWDNNRIIAPAYPTINMVRQIGQKPSATRVICKLRRGYVEATTRVCGSHDEGMRQLQRALFSQPNCKNRFKLNNTSGTYLLIEEGERFWAPSRIYENESSSWCKTWSEQSALKWALHFNTQLYPRHIDPRRIVLMTLVVIPTISSRVLIYPPREL